MDFKIETQFRQYSTIPPPNEILYITTIAITTMPHLADRLRIDIPDTTDPDFEYLWRTQIGTGLFFSAKFVSSSMLAPILSTNHADDRSFGVDLSLAMIISDMNLSQWTKAFLMLLFVIWIISEVTNIVLPRLDASAPFGRVGFTAVSTSVTAFALILIALGGWGLYRWAVGGVFSR